MKKTVFALSFFLLAFLLYASGTQEETSVDVIVFTAASTNDLMEDAGLIFTKETGIKVKLNPASSGTLAKQLEQGAFADVYVSASEKWISYANDRSLLTEYCSLMRNSLVLIAPTESPAESFIITLDSEIPVFEGCLSIADPAHAPAGKYAVEAMQSCGWYSYLSDRIQPGTDVRNAMSVVEFNEAELGIVYKTDAEQSAKVKILAVFPEESHSPIKYYCGLTKDSTEAGNSFYRFLTSSPEAAKLIKEYGFSDGADD